MVFPGLIAKICCRLHRAPGPSAWSDQKPSRSPHCPSGSAAPEVFVQSQAGHLVDPRRCCRRALHQPPPAGCCAHLLELAGCRQPGGMAVRSRGLAMAVQHQGGAVNLAVALEVEGSGRSTSARCARGLGDQQDAPSTTLPPPGFMGAPESGRASKRASSCSRPRRPEKLG